MKAIYNNQGARVPGMFEKGGSFPDLSGDGKVTRKDVLIGRGVIKKKKGGSSSTKKDSCYYKAKAAHKVFPSAYASGMIAKCRKKKAGK